MENEQPDPFNFNFLRTKINEETSRWLTDIQAQKSIQSNIGSQFNQALKQNQATISYNQSSPLSVVNEIEPQCFSNSMGPNVDESQYIGINGSTTIDQTIIGSQLQIGTVETVDFEEPASADITGLPPLQTLDLSIPRGPSGPPNELSIGEVTTVPNDFGASATITGVYPNQKLNLSIPQGPAGEIEAEIITLTVCEGGTTQEISVYAPPQN